MRGGIREVCDVVFKALSPVDIGGQHFDAGQPVLRLDTCKTSSFEGAASTVYAQGGKGNPRLVAWEGDKTLTVSFEDALISPESFALLSGAGLIRGEGNGADNTGDEEKVYVHTTYNLVIEGEKGNYYAKLPAETRDGATLCVSKESPVYATILDDNGASKYFLSAITDSEILVNDKAAEIGARGVVKADGADVIKFLFKDTPDGNNTYDDDEGVMEAGQAVVIDCYTVHGKGATRLTIEAQNFAGYYYVEASTLFRSESGDDFPAEFVIPRAKVQSNFTLTMSNSGDPSSLQFTLDAFPAYTKFDKTRKVLGEMQVIDSEGSTHNYSDKTIIGHLTRTDDDEATEGYAGSVFAQVAATEGKDA